MHVGGDLDVYTAPQLKEALDDVGLAGNTIVLDLSEVHFIDSTALGVLVAALQQSRAHDGELCLVVDDPYLLKIFRITGFDGLFSIFPRWPTLSPSLTRAAAGNPSGVLSFALRKRRATRSLPLATDHHREERRREEDRRDPVRERGQGGVVPEGPLLPLHRRRRASRPRRWVSRATWSRWTSRPSSPSGARWSRKTLIDAPLVKTETAKSVVRAVKKLAADATTLIIATDFDREGELIGLEALNLAVEENAKLVRTVRRARFSALTPGEIKRAFSNLDHLSEPLARAGEARQDIDLIWGATLTRFVSLATVALGQPVPERGPGPDAHPGAGRRAGEGAAGVRLRAVLGGQGRAGVRGAALQRRPQGRAVHRRGPGHGHLREAGHPGQGHRRQADLAQGAAAGAVQHHQLHQRRHLSRLQRRRGHAHRRGPVHGRAHQLPAYRQHGLSVVARPARGAGDPGPGRVRARGRRSCWPSRRCTPAGATSGPPTIRPSIPPAAPAGASWATGSGASTSWWPGASWPPWPTTRSWSPTGWTWPSAASPSSPAATGWCTAGWLEYYPYSRQKDLELPLLHEGRPGGTGRQADGRQRDPAARPATARDRSSSSWRSTTWAPRPPGTPSSRTSTTGATCTATRWSPPRWASRWPRPCRSSRPRIASPEMTAELEKDMDLISERDLTKEQVVTISRDLLRAGLRLAGAEPGADGGQDLRGHHRRPHPGRLPQVRHEQDPHHPLEGHQEALRGLRGLPRLRPDLSAAPAGRHHRHRRDLSAVRQPQGEDPRRPAALDPLPRPALPHQGRVPGEAGGPGEQGRRPAGDGAGRRPAAQEAGRPRRPAAKKTTAAKKPRPRRRPPPRSRAAKKTAAKKTARPRRRRPPPTAPDERRQPDRRRRPPRRRGRAPRPPGDDAPIRCRPRTPLWTTRCWRAWAAASRASSSPSRVSTAAASPRRWSCWPQALRERGYVVAGDPRARRHPSGRGDPRHAARSHATTACPRGRRPCSTPPPAPTWSSRSSGRRWRTARWCSATATSTRRWPTRATAAGWAPTTSSC